MNRKHINILKIYFTSVILLCSIVSFARQAMGEWRTHYAYNQVKLISQADEKIYAISNDGALFSLGKDDDVIDIYSKINNLNDNNISFIKYSKDNKILIVVYNNSNIDLINESGNVFNIPDINNKNIGQSKKINHIRIHDNIAYLSCDFGIVALNLKRKEIKDTYIIGGNASYVSIKNTTVSNNIIYAATEDKIYYADINKDNLLNYQNWKTISNTPFTKISDLSSVKSTIYVVSEDNILFSYNNSEWSKIQSNIRAINSDKEELWCISTDDKVNNLSKTISFSASTVNNVECDIEDKNIIWYSDSRGIGKYFKEENHNTFFKPSGPISKFSWRIKYADERMFVVPGGRWTTEYEREGSLMIYENNKWINIDNKHLSQYSYYSVNDLVDIVIDPLDKTHFYVASYGFGLFEFKNDALVKQYTAHNSEIETVFDNKPPSSPDYNNYHRVDGLNFDSKGNLWLLNVGNFPIKYMDQNGKFSKLAHTPILQFETLQDLLIDRSNENLKFMLAPRSTNTNSTALFVFDDKGTSSVNDDQTKVFTNFKDQDGKLFNPINFHCIEQDLNGTIWIGTTTGVAVIGNSKNIFSNDITVSRIKIPRNDGTGLADYLLGTERINDIAIDGANRKWFATENSGVFLTSSDGAETIHHFTTENSPLLSNNVQCIGINKKTGEVFFGTSNGLISFQSDAIDAGKNFDNVHAFPNPVRPDYHGLISITGLIENTTIRITDVNGNVVYETISNGGIATWNGLLKNGDRVATGVYVVMCVDKTGKKYKTTKILFVN